MKKKSWDPVRSCLLYSTVNPANFHPNWAFLIFLNFHLLFKYKTIGTHALTFFPLNISAVGSVENIAP